ncbi:lytic transglycosylase domain-containing protein [Roseitranquillus sediminis]|uniref:lytic transglycosylase domain-containing protein n=1 Tax=Roseitranquillus sediminis TaxID=2809051 RepID=UPI001D0C25DE|nr:lytic transglycosylase domain-containing protein [Roseitranquillus sediminis]MBM9593140.1 lytic transglycosylase domain-containing protein [Roseitranquillus sediminis]
MLRFALILLFFAAGLSAGTVKSTAHEAGSIASSLAAMRSGAWPEAETLAARAGGVAPDIVEWHRLRAGRGSLDEALAFLSRRADWPGLPFLRRRVEGDLPIGGSADAVVSFFGGDRPQTGTGSLALAVAYTELGRDGDAEALAVLAWLTQAMDAPTELAFISRYGHMLERHHVARLDMLLWEGDEQGARRMLPRVPDGWRRLAAARLALRGDTPGVDTLIEAVSEELVDDPGLAHERFEWRARRGRDADALDLVLGRRPEQLGRPEAWADRRRRMARELMRRGEAQTAYELASSHGLVEGSDYADLEWLSGYIALTYLDEPQAAADHFAALGAAVVTPISLGRAGYWLGRAEEALGNAEAARRAYAFGAEHQTSYYGLLAAERAGLAPDEALLGAEEYPDWKSLPASRSSVMAAAEMFRAAGERNLAERFMVHLAESLSSEEMGALADHALAEDEPHLALMVAKHAASRGIVLPRAYYPVVDLGVEHPDVPPELALSIARRESEFDPVVQSGAGARGLMQLMPSTAEIVSRNLGLDYSVGRLVSDPLYNARLGTEYLAGLRDRFGPSVALVSAGYNAGPGRPLRWMEVLGDPRSDTVDVVDWVEHVPFDETRNYIMRVAESLPIYRARLAGAAEALDLTSDLKGR